MSIPITDERANMQRREEKVPDTALRSASRLTTTALDEGLLRSKPSANAPSDAVAEKAIFSEANKCDFSMRYG